MGVVFGVALAGRGRLLGRGRALGRRARGRRPPAFRAALLAALVGRRVAGVLAAARAAGLLAAAVVLVDRRPGPPLGLLLGDAALFVAFGDVVGLALLLVGVLRLVALGHGRPPSAVEENPSRRR